MFHRICISKKKIVRNLMYSTFVSLKKNIIRCSCFEDRMNDTYHISCQCIFSTNFECQTQTKHDTIIYENTTH